ncbi:MAG: FAD-dependent thymidylate synthase [Oscillospiraceae bacterium]|nr:FAD-dependent thymidylate synthase [Oscillospiraceae bacterium]
MRIIKPHVEVEEFDPIKIMKNIEKACRTCYRSENKITEDSYKNLLRNALGKGHQSVIEHEKISVALVCDVGAYKDLTRHRIASFSIESTRYCAYDKDKFGNEISLIEPIFSDDEEKMKIWTDTMQKTEDNYLAMRNLGCTPDECRMLLPHSTAARVVMTANMREWLHIFSLRCSKFTHPSVQQLMIPLLLHFKETMPEIYEKVEYNENFDKTLYAEIKKMV